MYAKQLQKSHRNWVCDYTLCKRSNLPTYSDDFILAPLLSFYTCKFSYFGTPHAESAAPHTIDTLCVALFFTVHPYIHLPISCFSPEPRSNPSVISHLEPNIRKMGFAVPAHAWSPGMCVTGVVHNYVCIFTKPAI